MKISIDVNARTVSFGLEPTDSSTIQDRLIGKFDLNYETAFTQPQKLSDILHYIYSFRHTLFDELKLDTKFVSSLDGTGRFYDDSDYRDFMDLVVASSELTDAFCKNVINKISARISPVNRIVVAKILVSLDPDATITAIPNKKLSSSESYDLIKFGVDSVLNSERERITESINTLKTKYEKDLDVANRTIFDGVMLSLSKYKADATGLIYKTPIYPTTMKYKERIIPIPVDYQSKFYIKKLRICYDGSVFCSRSRHPNVSPRRMLCLGDLDTATLVEKINKVPEMVKMINLDSAFGRVCTREARQLFQDWTRGDSSSNVWSNEQ